MRKKPTSAERARFLAVCIIANNITDAARRAPKAPLYRVTVGIGHPVLTGHYYDKAACERALKNFRRADKAWLQESLDNGCTWHTLDV